MAVRNAQGLHRNRLTSALISALLLSTAGPAMAQNATTTPAPVPAVANDAIDIDRVSVVGSRIKRTEIEGPAPVVVITRADIEREGFQTVGDMLQTITQNTTSSFTGDLAVTGFTPNAQVVNLRNLGPGYTLTLINGRRPAQYPQPYNRDNNVVNIRAIPSSIIERVEILTGGASAIYGSDAVAGVVNIVTRKNFDGDLVKLTAGTTANGGGDSVNVEWSGGRTGDRWSAMYGFQYGENEPVFANQRDFLSDTRKGPRGAAFTNPGLSLATLRFNGVSPTTSVYYPGQGVCDRFGYTTVTTVPRGTYCGSFTQPAARSISNKNRFYSTYGSGTFDLTDNLQLFGTATYYASQASSSSGTEFWSTSGDQFNTNAAGARINGYFDPQFNSPTFLQRVFNPFELGGPEAATTEYDEWTYDVNFGVTGSIADRFDWEGSISHSEYTYTADRPRLLAQGIHDYFLGPRLGFTVVGGRSYPIHNLNLSRWNSPITPEIYSSFSTRAINEGKTGSSTLNFNISGDLFELPAGSVGFAAVLEGGRQSTDLQSDPRTNPLRPVDGQTIYNLSSSGRTVGERDRYALGAEFRVPIFSTLTAQIAGRYDKYDDITEVDDAITYMAGLEYRPFDSLLLRASYATSFRAPDLQLVYAEGAASFSGILDQYACRAGVGVGAALGPRTTTACNRAGDPTIYTTSTTIAGNPLLKEEEGESFGAGFVWNVADDMSFSVDYYRIKLEDQALQLSSGFLLSNEANCRLGVRSDGSTFPNSIDSSFCQNIFGLITRLGGTTDTPIQRINSAYINAALSDTSGIDSTFKYRWDTDRIGAFRLDLTYSLVLTDKSKQFETDPLVEFRDIPDLNSRSRARGSLSWSKGDWNTTVFGSRFGTSTSAAGADGIDVVTGEFFGRRLEPFMLYNLQVGKSFGDNVRADFTVVNVLDNQYRYDTSATGYPFYQPFVGADPLGRRFTLSVAYKF